MRPSLTRHSQHLELLGSIAKTDAEPQPAAGDHVNEGGVLRQPQRMMERGEQNERADRDPPRPRRDGGECGHDRREISVVREVMLGNPNRIEAGLLGVFDLSKHLRIELSKAEGRAGRVAKIQQVAKADRRSHGCSCTPLWAAGQM